MADQTTTIKQAVATALLLRQPTKIAGLVLDCTVTESHNASSDVTDHAVEEGFNVSDHVRPKPDELVISGIVTNTPFSRAQRRRTIAALGIVIDSVTDHDAILGQPGYAEQAYLTLRTMRESGKLITVTTRLRTYDNMAMTSLVVPRNREVGDSLHFTATFKLVRVVKNKLTAAKKSNAPAKKVSTGKQAPKNADDPAKKKSILYEGRERAKGILDKLGKAVLP